MNYVHSRQLDLNLLIVFDTVMSERSVTRAGDRLKAASRLSRTRCRSWPSVAREAVESV
jgi:hypothetical protein